MADHETDLKDQSLVETCNEKQGRNDMGKSGWANTRQIDYIVIDARYRNTARTARTNPSWHADMKQKQHHAVQKTQLYYNKAKKYKTPMPMGPGKRRNMTWRN